MQFEIKTTKTGALCGYPRQEPHAATHHMRISGSNTFSQYCDEHLLRMVTYYCERPNFYYCEEHEDMHPVGVLGMDCRAQEAQVAE